MDRSKYWLWYGYLGTLNACDQWPIDLTLQNRFYFVFIAEFVERLPTIFPVNIWSTYLFEIEHRWAKWLISDPSPKGTRWINDLSLDHADQWSSESLSRVDLIDHWSENGFAWKEHHGSEILIWILPKECTLNRGTSPGCLAGDLISPKDFDKIQILLNEKRSCVVVLCDLPKGRNLWSKWFIYYHFDLFHLQKQDVNSSNLNDNK